MRKSNALNAQDLQTIKDTFAASFLGASITPFQDNRASVYATAKLLAKNLGLPLSAFLPDDERIVGRD